MRTSIYKAINYAITPEAEGGGGYSIDIVAAAQPHLTVAHIDQQIEKDIHRRPRRAASAGAVEAIRALESVQARRQREEREAREAAASAAVDAQIKARRTAAREAALEKAVLDESNRPPLTKDEWQAVILTGLAPVIQYMFERINPGGDCNKVMEFFRGARIFDPSYAKTLDRQQAFQLIDKLQHLPAFMVGGQNSIIARLKKSWPAYRKNASEVMGKFGKDMKSGKDRSGITTWHYRMNLRIDAEKCDDDHCRYCARGNKNCDCYEGLKVWWEACGLAVLVVPSSAMVERVFSLVSNLFNAKQLHFLSDALELALFLAFNKRE